MPVAGGGVDLPPSGNDTRLRLFHRRGHFFPAGGKENGETGAGGDFGFFGFLASRLLRW